jgi:hypothetical protein
MLLFFSLVAAPFSLIGGADYVVTRSTDLRPNPLMKRSILPDEPGISRADA